MKVIPDTKLDFKDVLIVPNRSTVNSRKDVNLLRQFSFYHSPQILECIPIFCANMASIAGVEMANALSRRSMLAALHKYLSPEEIFEATGNNPRVFMSIGMKETDLTKLKEFHARYNYFPNICIDVPNAYISSFVNFCADVRDLCIDSIIMAGNVVTPEMTQELIIHGGVDIVKCGIGPGNSCTTRTTTGVSYPQVSVGIECSEVAHGLKSGDKRLGLVCLDGGFKEVGDLSKGFVAGVDFAMSSYLFSGAEECCGEWTYERDFDNEEYKEIELTREQVNNEAFITLLLKQPSVQFINKSEFPLYSKDYVKIKIPIYTTKKRKLKHYGMSSHHAQEKHEGSQKDYRASEGKVSFVDYKGPVDDIIREILGGIRSTGTYIGASSLKDFNRCGRFIKCLS